MKRFLGGIEVVAAMADFTIMPLGDSITYPALRTLDEFAAYDEDGNELRHTLDYEARLPDAAPRLRETGRRTTWGLENQECASSRAAESLPCGKGARAYLITGRLS